MLVLMLVLALVLMLVLTLVLVPALVVGVRNSPGFSNMNGELYAALKRYRLDEARKLGKMSIVQAHTMQRHTMVTGAIGQGALVTLGPRGPSGPHGPQNETKGNKLGWVGGGRSPQEDNLCCLR